jgi:hypothetical protein
MNRLKSAVLIVALTLTVSSSALGGTIIGARTSRTGTIIGARTGTIIGARTGNIAEPRAATGTSIDRTESSVGLLISKNVIAILRMFVEGSPF